MQEFKSPFEVAEMMGEDVTKAIDIAGKELLGRHYIKSSNKRRAKKSLESKGLELMFKCCPRDTKVHFWWELVKNGEVIDTSKRITGVVGEVKAYEDIYEESGN